MKIFRCCFFSRVVKNQDTIDTNGKKKSEGAKTTERQAGRRKGRRTGRRVVCNDKPTKEDGNDKHNDNNQRKSR